MLGLDRARSGHVVGVGLHVAVGCLEVPFIGVVHLRRLVVV